MQKAEIWAEETLNRYYNHAAYIHRSLKLEKKLRQIRFRKRQELKQAERRLKILEVKEGCIFKFERELLRNAHMIGARVARRVESIAKSLVRKYGIEALLNMKKCYLQEQ